MPADPITEGDPRPRVVTIEPKRLWFGFAGAVASWLVLGCADIVICWRACMHQEDFGVAPSHPGVRVLIFVVSLLLLGVTLAAGVISYRNFRYFSEQRKMMESLAVPRGEFMAIVGVILSLTLSFGMIWLALPPLFLELCWRAR